MAQISVRIDDDVKKSAEEALDEIGLSMSTAINVFLKSVARERRIPFELRADPFYGEQNMNRLRKAIYEVDEVFQRKPLLIDFLYIDEERIDSYMSQIKMGTLRSVSRTVGTSEGSFYNFSAGFDVKVAVSKSINQQEQQKFTNPHQALLT